MIDLDKIFCNECAEPAEYHGEKVTLNKPFLDEGGPKKYAVFTKNRRGDVVKVCFADRDNPNNPRYNYISAKEPSTPDYWLSRLSANDGKLFADKAVYDAQNRTINSMRDGVTRYLGLELGIEPSDKIFTVYTPPEEVAALGELMNGIDIIENHIPVEQKPLPGQILGKIVSTSIVDFHDESTDSTLVLQNKVVVSDAVLDLIQKEKRYFSPGYVGKLRFSDKYDFERYDLKPYHLAIVDSARGGSCLTFLDKGSVKMHYAFLDAEGNLSMQKVSELVDALPEAIKSMDLKTLQKFAPQLQKMVEAVQSSAMEEDTPPAEGDTPPAIEDDTPPAEGDTPPAIEDDTPPAEEDTPPAEEDEKKFSDADFMKAVQVEADKKFSVMAKAKEFMPETFSFTDKSVNDIMRAVLKEVHPDLSFKDEELGTAFKMLEKTNNYANFGKAAANDLAAKFDEEF